MPPAQRVKPADVEQLSRGAVGFAGVEAKGRPGMNNLLHGGGELAYGEVLAGPDVDMSELVVVIHQEYAGIREVVHVEKFASRIARTPDGDFGFAFHFRIVKLSNQGRQHVRLREIEIIVLSIQIGR